MNDLYNLVPFAPSGGQEMTIPPQTRTTSLSGGAVPLAGYNGAVIEVQVGLYTDGTHAITLEESAASGTGYAPVASVHLVGSLPTISQAGGDFQNYRFGYTGSKPYIRAVWTVTGSPGTGCVIGVSVLRGFKRHAPTTQ